MKMFKKGIPYHMVRLIQVWLSNRQTWVMFDGVRSRPVSLKQGVPQGSVLSPLLFIFYIDNLVSAVGALQINRFADDVAVWAQDADLERVTAKLQKVLEAIASWSTSWKMELPFQKSECSFITTNTEEAKYHPALQLNEPQNKHSTNPKFHGIT